MERGPSSTNETIKGFRDRISLDITDAIQSLAPLYPAHPEYGQPYGYIRFRMLRCEGPNCGAIVPATSKFELDKTRGVGLIIDGLDVRTKKVNLRLNTNLRIKYPEPTMSSGSVSCPICGFTTPRRQVVRQWERHKLPSEIVAVVYETSAGRVYSNPLDKQVLADSGTEVFLEEAGLSQWVPTETWPNTEPRRFSPPLYGYVKYSDCHTSRQLALLAALSKRFSKINECPGYHPLKIHGLVLTRAVEKNTSFCRWRNDRGGSHENTFAGKSIGMIWDHFEADPINGNHSLIKMTWMRSRNLLRTQNSC